MFYNYENDMKYYNPGTILLIKNNSWNFWKNTLWMIVTVNKAKRNYTVLPMNSKAVKSGINVLMSWMNFDIVFEGKIINARAFPRNVQRKNK